MLNGNRDIAITVLLKEASLPHSGLYKGLRGGLAILFQQALVQGATIHADANWNAGIAGGLSDFLHAAIKLADIARVHADGGATSIDGLEDVLRLEVDIRNHRDGRLLGNGRKRFRIDGLRAGNAHDIAAGSGQLRDLLQRAVNVVRLGIGHRLHRDGRVRADTDRAHLQLTSLAAWVQDWWWAVWDS